MKFRLGFIGLWLLMPFLLRANTDTLRLTARECEAVFLKNNLALIAEAISIDIKKAELEQAKIWPNPTFTFDQVNLWAKDYQTQGYETAPPLWNNFGRNQQFAFALEQTILTARKRKKLMELEQVGVDQAAELFKTVLASLKYELRNIVSNTVNIQAKSQTYHLYLQTILQTTSRLQGQVDKGNVPYSELVRLKNLELQLSNQLQQTELQYNEWQAELRKMLNLNADVVIQITNIKPISAPIINVQELKDLALNNSTMNAISLDTLMAQKLIRYEKANAVPDVVLKADYDRNGSTMLDFVGFGFSIDLPFFNRNQGKIKSAKHQLEQKRVLYNKAKNQIENDIALAYQNYVAAYKFYEQLDKTFEKNIDELMEKYQKNLLLRNINMLEYVDFVESYLETKDLYLDAQLSVNQRKEKVNVMVEKEIL